MASYSTKPSKETHRRCWGHIYLILIKSEFKIVDSEGVKERYKKNPHQTILKETHIS